MKRRFRFYLKLSVAAFAVFLTATILWFIFRIEQFILSRLPKEITVEKLSVSFLNQAFILSGAKVHGRPGTLCENKVLLEIAEAEGKFKLRQKKVTELSLKKATLSPEALKRGCLVAPGEKPDIRLAEGVGPEGIRIQITDGLLTLPEIGSVALQTAFTVKENEFGATVLSFERLNAANQRINAQAKKMVLALVKSLPEAMRLSDGEVSAIIKINHLEKIPRLHSRKLKVLAGDGEIRLSAIIRKGVWKVDSDVDLRHLKLTGESFFSMPMGLMQLTPENMWPMAEDSPGLLTFGFKAEATGQQLAKTYANEFRASLTRKVKGNLKKKIPVLPF